MDTRDYVKRNQEKIKKISKRCQHMVSDMNQSFLGEDDDVECSHDLFLAMTELYRWQMLSFYRFLKAAKEDEAIDDFMSSHGGIDAIFRHSITSDLEMIINYDKQYASLFDKPSND